MLASVPYTKFVPFTLVKLLLRRCRHSSARARLFPYTWVQAGACHCLPMLVLCAADGMSVREIDFALTQLRAYERVVNVECGACCRVLVVAG